MCFFAPYLLLGLPSGEMAGNVSSSSRTVRSGYLFSPGPSCWVTMSWLCLSVIDYLLGSSLRILPIVPSLSLQMEGKDSYLLWAWVLYYPSLRFLNSVHLFVNSPFIKLFSTLSSRSHSLSSRPYFQYDMSASGVYKPSITTWKL